MCLNAYLLTAVIRSFPPKLKSQILELVSHEKDQQADGTEDQRTCVTCSSSQNETEKKLGIPNAAISFPGKTIALCLHLLRIQNDLTWGERRRHT